jgi:hypothetical protein
MELPVFRKISIHPARNQTKIRGLKRAFWVQYQYAFVLSQFVIEHNLFS